MRALQEKTKEIIMLLGQKKEKLKQRTWQLTHLMCKRLLQVAVLHTYWQKNKMNSG